MATTVAAAGRLGGACACGPAAVAWLPAAQGLRRWASGKRDFFQRIDMQHLAKELGNLSSPAPRGGGAAREEVIFDPKLRFRPNRRLVPASLGGQAGDGDGDEGAAAGASSASGGFSDDRRRAKPWLHYESLRGDAYPTGQGAKGPRWRDLTHSEAQRMQEMYMRKRVLDRKIHWMKMQELPNPQKQAKMALRWQQQQEEAAKAQNDGADMYPPPFMDMHPNNKWLTGMEEGARKEEMESRFRTRIRQEKLENARIQKARVPEVGDAITDPIKRHVNRRLVRQREKIHRGLEEILTSNTAQILYEHLQGIGISIAKVRAKRPRQTQSIYYNLTTDHDPEWVQRQLDVVAPKLRSQLALKVNMGQTPAIRFVPYVKATEVRRQYLWRFAEELQDSIPVGGGFGKDVGVS